MAGSIRKFFESLAYTGLKPAPRGSAPKQGRARQLWDRLLNGGPVPNDPLYLSNRTWLQKARPAVLIAIPIVMVIGLTGYVMLTPPTPVDKPPSQLTPAELAARTATLPKDFSVRQNTDLQVVEVSVEKGGSSEVTGVLKNQTQRSFASAELTFDLTDDAGSQLGGVSTRVGAIGPGATVPFRFPVAQKGVAFVLVREVRGSL